MFLCYLGCINKEMFILWNKTKGKRGVNHLFKTRRGTHPHIRRTYIIHYHETAKASKAHKFQRLLTVCFSLARFSAVSSYVLSYDYSSNYIFVYFSRNVNFYITI